MPTCSPANLTGNRKPESVRGPQPTSPVITAPLRPVAVQAQPPASCAMRSGADSRPVVPARGHGAWWVGEWGGVCVWVGWGGWVEAEGLGRGGGAEVNAAVNARATSQRGTHSVL